MSTVGIPMRQQVEEYITNLQDEIVLAFETLDPNAPPFKRDSWERTGLGVGKSCVFESPIDDGTNSSLASHFILEKAGVNTSIIYGVLPLSAIEQMGTDHTSLPTPDYPDGAPFLAAGLSLIIHPRNPHAPTIHANYKYFEITEAKTFESDNNEKVLAWWFSGGSDLTPSYLYEEDAVHFHSTLKTACDKHGSQFYPSFKKWCDEYFFIPHRGETRGIGGLFFDDINSGPHLRLSNSEPEVQRAKSLAENFAFFKDLGNAFIPSYIPILRIRYSMPSTPHQRRWQLVRRGRYVEFNLIYDQGTKFGLNTPGARIESMLMSLPETARWEYMPELGGEGTEEGKLVAVLKEPKAWV